jgi:hypothetical protein
VFMGGGGAPAIGGGWLELLKHCTQRGGAEGDLGGEPGEVELIARPQQWRPGKQRGAIVAWAMARTRDRRRGAGWLMVLYEGRMEEGMKWGMTASGSALFKWRCGEQRKGGPGLVFTWGQEKKGEGGPRSGQQRGAAGSGPRLAGGGAIA